MTPCTPTKRFTQMAVRAVAVAIVFTCLRAAPAIAADGIEVTLSLPDHILIGEPLPALVRVRNTSDRTRPVILPDIGRFSRKKIVFSLEKPGTSNFVDIAYPDIYVGGIPMLSSIPYAVRHLDTGEAIECGFSLVYDFCDERRHQRLFDVPGKYRIRVSVFEPLGIGDDEEIINNGFKWRAIQSEAAQVEVRMPEGDRDRRALEAFDTLPCEYSVYAPLFVDNLAIKPLQSFFHEYGDTRLGHRTALPLGVAVANGQVRDGKHGILEALMTLRQGGDAEMSEMASAVVAQFPQLDPSFPHAYYVEKPVETFIDVIRAADTTGADSAAMRLGRLTTAQKALLLLLCERAETTITNRLFCFQQPGASQSGRNWRMDIPSERIAWLLCGTFGLEDGKFQRRRGEVDDDSWFRDIVRECVDALAALRKEEEDRLPGRNEYLLYLLRRHMLAADAGERQGLPRNGRSETALTALATNAANNIRLAVAPNGGTPLAWSPKS